MPHRSGREVRLAHGEQDARCQKLTLSGSQSQKPVSPLQRPQGERHVTDSALKSATVVRTTPKIGRNDPCPCGSGKKYKNCCGRNA